MPIEQLGSIDAFQSVSEALEPVSTSVSLPLLSLKPATGKTPFELECSKKLATVLSGETESVTEVGRIDVLTATSVIELKVARNWKHGIGQLLTYGFYHPDKDLQLVLVGKDANEYVDIAQFHCNRFGIKVSVFNF
ncbi:MULTISPECIES: hypothetical protein [Leptolyngbya]|uniref:hypothetical protein n=1 Tax=Leptolyngbya TaxID=47251 RepID=UPI001688303A|nr:hypothetical protein [Leptolyngbya sp. FACHB-1624]MBD1857708.1 hypothetical protein [Leptolyngbya sp. FACHB-1624]